MSDPPVLSVEDLTVTIGTRRGPARAVAGVDWSVRAGETLALVGESGSGKSMSVLAATGLAPAPPGWPAASTCSAPNSPR
ncbi:peptide/nickel transport system ATP-binding protein [Micromonospora endolithica]|nr:peptide/nickel transport system ATP-binding protein [Micromonospora endolithica]